MTIVPMNIPIASGPIVLAIQALYGIAKAINDFLDEHIEEMKKSENTTISRTGRVLEAAKYGFGIGYITSVVIIATGQFLLGNPLAAAAAVATAATLTNPVAMTCAAVGAIYYGWWALSDQERNEILEKLSNGLQIGIELIKSILRFVIDKTKEILSPKNIEEIKKFISSVAKAFGHTLGDVTHKLSDVVGDTFEAVKKKTGETMDKTLEIASSTYETVKVSTEKAAGNAREAIGKIKLNRVRKTSNEFFESDQMTVGKENDSYMPHQNRVTPFGNLIATPARGTFMGNRGILHDSEGKLTAKRWTHQHWVTCLLEVPGREKRKVFTPGNYTELFFHDEATALAAGHRPCAECRREDFKRFVTAWHKGNADFGLSENATIGEIDRILHRERVTRSREKVTFEAIIEELPDGVFITHPEAPDTACLIWRGHLYAQHPDAGGEIPIPFFKGQKVTVLTPRSITRAIAAGYVPQVLVG